MTLSVLNGFIYQLSPKRLFTSVIYRFHQYYIASDSEVIQTISLKDIVNNPIPQEISLPTEADYIQKPENIAANQNKKRIRNSIMHLPSADLYLNEMRKYNKHCMKNSWNRAFYFPNKDFILRKIPRDMKESQDIFTNYLKLAEKYKKTNTKKKVNFLPTILPPILEYCFY